MARTAKVTSVDAIRDFKVALIKFYEEASDAMANLEMEITRVAEWIEHDRPAYWKQQVRRRDDKLVQARSNLERCQINTFAGEVPACRDEKEAVYKAQRRLREAEDTARAVRKWGQVIRHERIEYRGSVNQFTTWLESDYQRVLSLIQRIIRTLEDYATIAAPITPQDESNEKSMARSGDSEDSETTSSDAVGNEKTDRKKTD